MMAKKRKHHRNIRQERFSGTVSVPTPNETIDQEDSSITTAPVNANILVVRHDLITTLITTAILVAVIIIAAITNKHYSWTLHFGNTLYNLLHIR